MSLQQHAESDCHVRVDQSADYSEMMGAVKPVMH